jgi:D-alanyl-D-alanine carboxypeptidase/D-alanyl-D-alanine-endopeptidase (penicillin-binding protein 4)
MRISRGPGLLVICWLLQSCTSSRRIAQTPDPEFVHLPDLRSAHAAVCVFDPEKSSYLVDYQSDKYFVPASNTKLFSLYAGLKCLGDSLPGIRWLERDSALLILPTGDPSFLHPDYTSQPVLDFLKSKAKPVYIASAGWAEEAWGRGWSWDDYNDDYMVERSPLPVYGNLIRWVQERQDTLAQNPGFPSTPTVYSIPEINWKVQFPPDTAARHFFVKRALSENIFYITEGPEKFKTQDLPFVTHGIESAVELLKDTLGREIRILTGFPAAAPLFRTLGSRPVDSLFRPMMYRSDNFFAEQTLLMACFKRFGIMKDRMIIDSLLAHELSGLPQRPNWVDGSGLSRYNYFSARDFIWLLNLMKNEFGMDRMKRLLPTAGTGTLSGFPRVDSGYVFAKTGSMTGVIALSGYLISRQQKLLLFSILVNNFYGSSSAIRREIGQYLSDLRAKN